MADLRINYIEDYAGGLLNVSRQALASNGEVLSQDGFLTDSTIYVEDGTGIKSGLKLGVGLAESVDPTSPLGIVNVRYADRTYAKIRDLKIFSTATASAQAALSRSVTESISVLEGTLEHANTRLDTSERNLTNLDTRLDSEINLLNKSIATTTETLSVIDDRLQTLEFTDQDANSNFKLGFEALDPLNAGVSNLALGYRAGGDLKEGSKNILIGHEVGQGLAEGSNNIMVGAKDAYNISNEILLGNSNHNSFKVNTDVYTPVKAKAASPFGEEPYDFGVADFKSLVVTKLYKESTLHDISVTYDSLRSSVDAMTLGLVTYT
jgi:hypothetical protein